MTKEELIQKLDGIIDLLKSDLVSGKDKEYTVAEYKPVNGPFAESIIEAIATDNNKFTSSEACDEWEDYLDAGRYSNKNQ